MEHDNIDKMDDEHMIEKWREDDKKGRRGKYSII